MSTTLKRPTLVVTGITGFLGNYMALEALRRGHHVRGTLRRMERADHVRSALERTLATAGTLPFKTMAHAIRSAHPEAGRKVGTRELPNWFLRVFSLFEPTTRVILAELGYMAEVSHDKAKRR